MDYGKIDKSPKNHEDLSITLNKGVAVLENLGIQYSLGRGTLLGIHRDKSYTEGENDIDIDIFDDKQIHTLINELPFQILLTTIASGKYQQLVMIDPDTGVLFDIWFYSVIKNKYFNKHDQGYFSLNKQKVHNLQKIKFENIEYSCFDPDWYCEYWYGVNWKTPVKYSKTWIQFYKEDCAGFEYHPEDNPNYISFIK